MVPLLMTLSKPTPFSRSPYSSKANISQTVHATAGSMTSCRFLSDSWGFLLKISDSRCFCENSVKYVPPDSFLFRLYKIQFWPGFTPDPAEGAYDAASDFLVGWGGYHSAGPP